MQFITISKTRQKIENTVERGNREGKPAKTTRFTHAYDTCRRSNHVPPTHFLYLTHHPYFHRKRKSTKGLSATVETWPFQCGTTKKRYDRHSKQLHSVTMAKGKAGLWLESWKFSIYLALPLLASWYYNDPKRQQASIDYWKYVQYPPNPNTDMRKQISEMQKQKEQREVYRQQMQELQERARKSREQPPEDDTQKRGWWRSLWTSKKESSEA